ncbi:hypothetical protein D917_02242 [Trichinella nativa]|uniref:Uncharacterized protein n=1 Tax=Trichinella nativa TaxID=6335 RepID=A0A1Y3EGJ2_9BILA|nr:hypothetical protein D917_02242 [Trichinella nativa]
MYLFQKTAALWDVGRTVEVTVRTVSDVPFFKHDSFITLFINVRRYQKQLILTAADLAVVISTDHSPAYGCFKLIDTVGDIDWLVGEENLCINWRPVNLEGKICARTQVPDAQATDVRLSFSALSFFAH